MVYESGSKYASFFFLSEGVQYLFQSMEVNGSWRPTKNAKYGVGKYVLSL